MGFFNNKTVLERNLMKYDALLVHWNKFHLKKTWGDIIIYKKGTLMMQFCDEYREPIVFFSFWELDDILSVNLGSMHKINKPILATDMLLKLDNLKGGLNPQKEAIDVYFDFMIKNKLL